MTRTEMIQSLRELADLLEAKPDFPEPWYSYLEGQPIGITHRRLWSLSELQEVARQLGSFKKRYNDDYFECVVTLPSGLELVYYTDREKVCKKTVSYDCEDAESILAGLGGAE